MSYQAGQTAQAVDERLRASVRSFKEAEHQVVVWFGEMKRRKLYRELGYASMRQYALAALGFSASRANDFGRLADRLTELPRVRAAVESGALGYTKARELVSVASPRTEEHWLQAAAQMSRRELEQTTTRVRRKARARRLTSPGQAELLPASPAAEDHLAAAVPSAVSLRLTAEQRARYDALWQKLGRAPNADDVLAALALLAGTSTGATACEKSTSATVHPRGCIPPVQIHVQQCPDCGAMESAGRPLDLADAERAQCDAAIATPGRRNTTTIAPRVRREVLARDHHRCQAPGCDHRMFLEVHHRVPRSRGGSNAAANLITLCSACHRLWHVRGWSMPGVAGVPHGAPPCS